MLTRYSISKQKNPAWNSYTAVLSIEIEPVTQRLNVNLELCNCISICDVSIIYLLTAVPCPVLAHSSLTQQPAHGTLNQTVDQAGRRVPSQASKHHLTRSGSGQPMSNVPTNQCHPPTGLTHSPGGRPGRRLPVPPASPSSPTLDVTLERASRSPRDRRRRAIQMPR